MGSYRVFPAALAAGVSCALFLNAPAATADIGDDIARVQAELSDLQTQAAAAAEEANDATLDWQEAQQAVIDKQAELAATQQTLAASQNSLNQVVSQIYRNGGVDPSLLVLASSDTASNWLATLDTARILAGQQNSALVRTEAAEQQLVRDEAALTKAEKRAERARDDILDAKAAIDENREQLIAIATGE